ncbi:disease resistance protein RPS6-like [Brassica napus]|uniref:disease resistance protein RPS6-like n=1 Tax=Brassica napus TaxID=3708 RepID=UPI002078FE14|nr:disease resistance protein RPS6-like [Brassica napus]
MASPSSFSPPSNWVYDVFPSFSGEDVRVTFLSHFLKELDRKLIIAFKDNEIERSHSLGPELKQAIRTSRIAVVIFSEKYPSSSWCLDELLDIVKCKDESGQIIIPIFYGLDPSHVRKQTGKFGEAFAKTCQTKTEDETKLWRQSLTDVANVLGYHSQNCPQEAKMIEAIANDVLGKLNLAQSKDFEDFVGMEDHIANMSVLLQLESQEVRMVGIWGSSGIGKTTIARVLHSQLSRQFQGSVFIDRAFVYKTMEIYNSANPDDYNMKLHLLRSFLSELLDKKDIRIDSLNAVQERLKYQKVLIFIDDLDDQMVLDTLAGQTHWFGSGSRIIVITKDRHFLKAHGIDHIYEVCLPSTDLALEMFCRSAFRQNSPPAGLVELASEIALCAGSLPLGLKVLGAYLRGRDKEDWIDMIPSLRSRLNGKIERTLIVSYEGLNNKKDKAIFRHISCIFNGEQVDHIKMLLKDSDLDFNIGFKNLVDKSLVHVRRDSVEMHCLLQDMGKEIVRAQSDEPGEREFLMDSKEICDILEDNTGTKKVLGISLDMDETDELHIHKNAFRGMHNLFFLKIYNAKRWDKKMRWCLPKGFDYLPPKLRLLRLDGYPMKYMPSNFRPENLVELQMSESKLQKLWEGVHSLAGLRVMDLEGSKNLEEVPDLSMATNLQILFLDYCSSLVELTSSIQHLNKLKELSMSFCENLETLPTGIYLQSLDKLFLDGCSKLKILPDISTNISTLILDETAIDEFHFIFRLKKPIILGFRKTKIDKLWAIEKPLTSLMTKLSQTLKRLFLSDIPSLVELPSSIQNFHSLDCLGITECINLETLPAGINLQYLYDLDLKGCSRLRTFPDISTNVRYLLLDRTGIVEVPWWIKNFSKLGYLGMESCSNLERVSLNIYKLKKLKTVQFSYCRALTGASWTDGPSEVEMATENIHSKLTVFHETSSSLPHNLSSEVSTHFICLNLEPEVLLHQRPFIFKKLVLSGEEVPSYFTHRTTGTSTLTVPLPPSSLSQPFLRFRACAVGNVDYEHTDRSNAVYIRVNCRFRGIFGDSFDSFGQLQKFWTDKKDSHLFILECRFPLNKDSAPIAQMNYDHVEIQLLGSNRMDSTLDHDKVDHVKIISESSKFNLKGWGIRLAEDCLIPKNQFGNPYTLPRVCEDNIVFHETKQECGDSCEETKNDNKRMRIA